MVEMRTNCVGRSNDFVPSYKLFDVSNINGESFVLGGSLNGSFNKTVLTITSVERNQDTFVRAILFPSGME